MTFLEFSLSHNKFLNLHRLSCPRQHAAAAQLAMASPFLPGVCPAAAAPSEKEEAESIALAANSATAADTAAAATPLQCPLPTSPFIATRAAIAATAPRRRDDQQQRKKKKKCNKHTRRSSLKSMAAAAPIDPSVAAAAAATRPSTAPTAAPGPLVRIERESSSTAAAVASSVFALQSAAVLTSPETAATAGDAPGGAAVTSFSESLSRFSSFPLLLLPQTFDLRGSAFEHSLHDLLQHAVLRWQQLQTHVELILQQAREQQPQQQVSQKQPPQHQPLSISEHRSRSSIRSSNSGSSNGGSTAGIVHLERAAATAGIQQAKTISCEGCPHASHRYAEAAASVAGDPSDPATAAGEPTAVAGNLAGKSTAAGKDLTAAAGLLTATGEEVTGAGRRAAAAPGSPRTEIVEDMECDVEEEEEEEQAAAAVSLANLMGVALLGFQNSDRGAGEKGKEYYTPTSLIGRLTDSFAVLESDPNAYLMSMLPSSPEDEAAAAAATSGSVAAPGAPEGKQFSRTGSFQEQAASSVAPAAGEPQVHYAVEYFSTTGTFSRWVIAQHPFRQAVHYSNRLFPRRMRPDFPITLAPLPSAASFPTGGEISKAKKKRKKEEGGRGAAGIEGTAGKNRVLEEKKDAVVPKDDEKKEEKEASFHPSPFYLESLHARLLSWTSPLLLQDVDIVGSAWLHLRMLVKQCTDISVFVYLEAVDVNQGYSHYVTEGKLQNIPCLWWCTYAGGEALNATPLETFIRLSCHIAL